MLFAKVGTPPEIVSRLEQLAINSYAESDRIKNVRENLADEDAVLTGDSLREFIARTWPAYRNLTKATGFTVG